MSEIEFVPPILTITDEDALRGLRHAVSVKGPDHVYTPPVAGHTACVYVWELDGQLSPQCIVGFALHHLGVPLELMHATGCNDINIGGLAGRLLKHGYVFQESSIDILRAAQVVQDWAMRVLDFCTCDVCRQQDATWGAALAAAEELAAARANERAAQRAAGAQPTQPPAEEPPTESAGS